jgi:hypothetical protein
LSVSLQEHYAGALHDEISEAKSIPTVFGGVAGLVENVLRLGKLTPSGESGRLRNQSMGKGELKAERLDDREFSVECQ